eukprot:1147947-Pelagomonas_calceolata.AAC.3
MFDVAAHNNLRGLASALTACQVKVRVQPSFVLGGVRTLLLIPHHRSSGGVGTLANTASQIITETTMKNNTVADTIVAVCAEWGPLNRHAICAYHH